MFKKAFLGLLTILFISVSCDDDDVLIVPEAGTISGGPFEFVVDGVEDYVSGIQIQNSNALMGSQSSWVITDDTGTILGLPPTLADVEGVNFDGAGAGICLIWYLRYEGTITGLETGANANNLGGSFDLSNSIQVTRQNVMAGTLSGGPFTFIVDGEEDYVSGISVDTSNAVGALSTFVITDDTGSILGLPPTIDAVEGVNFNGAGAGVCFIWHLTYQDGIQGLEAGSNTGDLSGSFALSNSIQVTRQAIEAGTLSGGPFNFIVDGTEDFVSGITLDESNAVGGMSTWVITDDAGTILGLPPTLDAVEGVNFDGAGAGVCLIWHLKYQGELTGLEAGGNASNIMGSFDLSNSITVNRSNPMGAVLSGGPFVFCIDETDDFVSGITIDESNAIGANSTYVITDDAGNILGVPPTLEAVEGVNFNGASAGVCYIWNLRYQDNISGLEAGMNVSDLTGAFALSNGIQVTRNKTMAATLSGGPFTFTIDGVEDMVSGITVDYSNAMGTNETFVITDEAGNILGLPPTLADVEGVNFDGAGTGVCLIWNLKFEDGLQGAEVGMNAADLQGCFSLSNAIQVNRVAP